ncbi:MAG: response regulator [Proteobacteria bacterium]|nr:response regulator [Pseudomonadota bacterium]
MPKARILAVDDQRYFRELIEGLLTGEGYQVQTASNGEEALHILEREDFDVIITDLVMPGIDGCELVERVKERNPDQEIIMVTGVVDVKTAVEAMKQGATDYILKPFDRKTLARSLDGILQRRRLREEHARLVAENLEYMEVLSLYERAQGLFSTLSLEPLAERIIEGLCLETRAQGGVVWLAQDSGETRFRLMGARGLIRVDEEPEEMDIERLGAEFQPLLDEGQSIVVDAARPRGDGDGGVRSAPLFVPIRHAGSLLGLARLTDKLEGEVFDDRDRAAAEKFVSCGALAVVNALRFRSLERRSFRDPATKAYTHAYFEDVVRNEIQKANRFGRPFSIVRVDVGSLSTLRRSTSESQLGHWLEGLVHHVTQALRATDLMAVESESRFVVLLPETDSLGAAVLKERIRAAIERSGVLDSVRGDGKGELSLAAASFPSDGTQLESLDRVLDARLEEHRTSLLRSLKLEGAPFEQALEALLEHAELAPPEMPERVARFLIDEVSRRPLDRGVLILSPGAQRLPAVSEHLGQLAGTEPRIEVVLVCEKGEAPEGGASVTCVAPRRSPSARPFLIYYGEGPAYAMVFEDKPGDDGLAFFHTADRALVEHLAFELQRELGVPLGI